MTGPGTRLRVAAGCGFLLTLPACAQIGLPAEAGGEAGTVSAGASAACGADELQGLIGTSVGTLNSAVLPENRRVIFPGMTPAEDYVPDRLNVVVGIEDEITRVYCG